MWLFVGHVKGVCLVFSPSLIIRATSTLKPIIIKENLDCIRNIGKGRLNVFWILPTQNSFFFISFGLFVELCSSIIYVSMIPQTL